MTVANGAPPGLAWASQATELARWTIERLVNRTDVWGAYRPLAERGRPYQARDGTVKRLGNSYTAPARTRDRGHVLLTEQVVRRHYAATLPEHVIGTHTTGPGNTSLWGAVEVDWHGPQSRAPEVNLAAALAWYGRLKALRFHPLLTDSNGAGGYHLRVLFSEPVATPRVFAFSRWLARDHAEHGILSPPETFPKQPCIEPGAAGKTPYGNWLRAPGRHHTRDYWSRVWGDGEWLEGPEAVAFILSLKGDSPDLIPAEAAPADAAQSPRPAAPWKRTVPRRYAKGKASLERRIRAYRARLPNLGEAQGRDDVAYQFAAFLTRDLGLPAPDALPWLAWWDLENSPPKGEDRLRVILEDALRYGKRPVGCGLNGSGDNRMANHTEGPAEDAAGQAAPPEQDGRPQGAEAPEAGALDPAALLELAKSDPAAAVEKALQAPTLAALARLKGEAPGDLELLYRGLKQAGCKGREVQGLERAVNQERKRLRRETGREQRAKADGRAEAPDPSSAVGFSNYYEEEVETEDGKVAVARIGYPVQAIDRRLKGLTGGWPKRVGGLLFIEGEDHTPVPLENPNALFAMIGRHLPERNFNLLRWAGGPDKVSQERFYEHQRQTCECFDGVECVPHWPPLPRHYYMHPPVEGGDGRALQGLLEFFSPATLVDADLLKAMFLTGVWGGPPGQRPGFLITARADDEKKGRGVGKTALIRQVSRVLGGRLEATSDDDFDRFKTRLLSPAALGKRVVLIDNVKSLRFSDADLEAAITSDVISGHRMYEGEGQRLNVLLWCLTLNGASLSSDLAQRNVIIELGRPEHDGDWEARVADYIDRHRWAIIGDCIAALKAPAEPLGRHSRWGLWEDAVLARVAEPFECQVVLAERQKVVNDDAEEAELVRQAFREELQSRKHDPDRQVIFIPSRDAALIVNNATGERRPVNRACSYLNTLPIPELRRSADDGARGWRWAGPDAPPGVVAVPLNVAAPFEVHS